MITEEIESQLRTAFARVTCEITVPEAARSRLQTRNYHPRRMRQGLGLTAVTGLAAASALAAALIVVAGPAGTAAPSAVSFDAYTFTMPSGFHQVHPSARCRPMIAFALPPNRHRLWGKVGLPVVPKYGKKMMLAASAAGGCLAVALAPSYRPTAATPDPELVGKTKLIRIGPFHGRYVLYRLYSGRLRKGVVLKTELVRLVYVELPVGHGNYRDLVVGGARLSRHQLITIIGDGLKRR